MKGFKKDGKFRPTEKKSKSSLKKSDVRKKKTFHTCPECEQAEREQIERAKSRSKVDLEYYGEGANRHPVKGSPMYEEYLKKYPDSHIAHDVRTWGFRGGHGSFGTNLMEGDYGEAWWRADGENKKKMLELGFGTKYMPDFDNDMTHDRLDNIVQRGNAHDYGIRNKESLDGELHYDHAKRKWNELNKQQKQDKFEHIILDGTHFNEDNEENWARYNYGDTSWDKLPKSVQDRLLRD